MVKTYKYDAFGVEKNIDSSDTNAFRYCGEYFDKETGTIYLRARHYNPSTGRFTQRDTYAGRRSDPLSLNLYTYCGNNPIKFVDPSGHDAVAAASFMANNPKPTVNSASDANLAYEWNKKFKENLNAPSSANSASDAAYYSKVVNAPSFKVNSASDAVHYKKQNDLYTAWSSIVKPATKRPLVTSPVRHSEYRNDAEAGTYRASRGLDINGNLVYHGGIDFYPSDAYVGSDRTSNGLFGSDGTPRNVYAMADGTVVAYCAAYCGNSDQAIIVRHNGFYALYGEISTNVEIGDTIQQGQQIGVMVSTNIPSLMLHLEILVGNYPEGVFLGGSAREEYQVDPTYVYDFPDF